MIAAAEILDERKYGRLLARALPTVIETEEDNARLLAGVDRLMSKGEGNLSFEETRLLRLLVRLVEDFEAHAYPMPAAPPHEIIKHLMEARRVRQADLLPILGSRGVTSEVVTGKRLPSKEQAKRLANFFDLSVDLFI